MKERSWLESLCTKFAYHGPIHIFGGRKGWHSTQRTCRLKQCGKKELPVHILVYPYWFGGKHNPSDVRLMFTLLEVFDALLAPSQAEVNDRQKPPQDLSPRILSRASLIYWRERIHADLRRRLESFAAKDLLVLVERWEEPTGKPNRVSAIQQEVAEEAMRTVLRLDEDRWRDVLGACGC